MQCGEGGLKANLQVCEWNISKYEQDLGTVLILAKTPSLNWKALNLQHIATALYTYLSLKNIAYIHWEESVPSDLHKAEQTARYVEMNKKVHR